MFAGTFTQPGHRLAAWNGTSWRDFEGSAPRLNQSANSLAVYQGQLYAAGEFTRIGIGQGEVVAVGMARWDGDSWNSVPGSSTSVNKLLVYDGRLIIGGNFVSLAGQPFSRIAAWDGKSWSALGSGVDREATALVEFRGDLVVSGSFRNAGGRSASRIARWDGAAWHPLGAGLDQPARELVVHNDRLVAIGTFLNAGGAPARFVAQWDGAAWTPMEGGVGYLNGDQFSGYAPTGGASFDGTFYLAGAFLEAGNQLSPYFARWDAERGGCADFNCSGSTDSQDFFDFLAAFFGELPDADVNGDALINSQDFFDFLGQFFEGC